MGQKKDEEKEPESPSEFEKFRELTKKLVNVESEKGIPKQTTGSSEGIDDEDEQQRKP